MRGRDEDERDPRAAGQGSRDAKGLGPREEDVLVEPYFGPAYVYNSETRATAGGKDVWRKRHPESDA